MPQDNIIPSIYKIYNIKLSQEEFHQFYQDEYIQWILFTPGH